MTKKPQGISDLPKIGAPAQRALESVGITMLKQLTDVTETELLMLHGMGQKAVRILREELKAHRFWNSRQACTKVGAAWGALPQWRWM